MNITCCSRLVCIFVLAVLVLGVCPTSARAQDKNRVDLPENPVAAIAKMPVQEPAKEGLRIEVIDEAGKPLAGVSLVVVVDVEKSGRDKMRALQAQARKKYKDDLDKARTALFVLMGQRFVTGADGSVVVPKLEPLGAVFVVRDQDTALAPACKAA